MHKKLKGADFVHCGGNAAYTAAFLRPFMKAKIVADVHGDSLGEAKMKWDFRHDTSAAYWVLQAMLMDSVSYGESDFFLVVSKPQASRLVEKRRIPQTHIALVRNGVDLEMFQPSPTGHQNRDFVVCYAGGFQPWQGLGDLLKASELCKSPNVRIRIIGFTARDHDFRAQIAARLGSRVELIDRLAQPELAAQLSSADILIIPRPRHPAVEVALPTKFAEYAALGKPLIVCDVDETAQLVRDNQCGLVSPPNAAGLAETITTAAALSRNKLEQMGQNARALAEREFAWEVIGRNYAALLTNWYSNGAHAA